MQQDNKTVLYNRTIEIEFMTSQISCDFRAEFDGCDQPQVPINFTPILL